MLVTDIMEWKIIFGCWKRRFVLDADFEFMETFDADDEEICFEMEQP